MTDEFYICDLRPVWRKQKYVTFWRPKNANYAWALSWSGKYDRDTIKNANGYYYENDGTTRIRFPVPCHIADAIGVAPKKGDIDGDAGPVVLNTVKNRAILRKAAATL